jgi:hypothetical protein
MPAGVCSGMFFLIRDIAVGCVSGGDGDKITSES